MPNLYDTLVRTLEHVTKEEASDSGGVEHPDEIDPERAWLLKTLGLLTGAALDELPHDTPQPEPVTRALRLFQHCNHRGYRIQYGVEEVREAVARNREMRRTLFWESAAQQFNKSGRQSTRYYEIIDGYRLYELSPDDADWLAADAVQRSSVQDRLLAFDALANLPRTEDELDARRTVLREVAEQDTALRKRLDRMMNRPFTPSPSSARYERQHRAREIRRERVRQRNKAELEAHLDGIRAGTDIGRLRFLYGAAEHSMSSYTAVDGSKLEERFSTEVAAAARTGWKNFWRSYRPPLPHEREQRNTTPGDVILGMCGLAAEIADGLDPTTLDLDSRELAIRYSACELNGFCGWLEQIAVDHPASVRDVLREGLAADYGHPDDGKGLPQNNVIILLG